MTGARPAMGFRRGIVIGLARSGYGGIVVGLAWSCFRWIVAGLARCLARATWYSVGAEFGNGLTRRIGCVGQVLEGHRQAVDSRRFCRGGRSDGGVGDFVVLGAGRVSSAQTELRRTVDVRTLAVGANRGDVGGIGGVGGVGGLGGLGGVVGLWRPSRLRRRYRPRRWPVWFRRRPFRRLNP